MLLKDQYDLPYLEIITTEWFEPTPTMAQFKVTLSLRSVFVSEYCLDVTCG